MVYAVHRVCCGSVHANAADGVGTPRPWHPRTAQLTAHLGHSGGLARRPRGRERQSLQVDARRPENSIAGRLQVCSSTCTHGLCVQTRRAAARAPCTPSHTLWAAASPHAMSCSLPPLTLSSAVKSRRLTLRCKGSMSRCATATVDGALLKPIACGPCTPLEPMAELDSRVCKLRIRRPLHTAALILRVALSVASCARVRQVHCFF